MTPSTVTLVQESWKKVEAIAPQADVHALTLRVRPDGDDKEKGEGD
jgi:hypothetical protein